MLEIIFSLNTIDNDNKKITKYFAKALSAWICT